MRIVTAWKSWPAALAGAALVGAAGAGIAVQPLSGPALLFVGACWLWPATALVTALASSMLALPVLLAFPRPELTTAATALGLLLAACRQLLRRRGWDGDGSRLVMPLAFFALALTFLTVGAVGVVPAAQAATGIRIFLTPVLVLIVTSGLGRPSIVRLIRLSVALVTLNAVAALFEMYAGVPALLAYGLQYGTNVRQIGGVLRAPGLTATNFDLGLTSASLAVAYFALLRTQQRWASTRLLVIGLTLSTLAVVLSATRTALVLLLVGVAVCTLTERAIRQRSLRIIGSISLVAVSALTFGRLAGFDTTSLRQRLDLWHSLFQHADLLVGSGIGSAGAATRSRFSVNQHSMVVDNYYFSVLLQGGLFALLAFCAALLLVTWQSRHGSLPHLSLGLVAAVAVSMLFLESWEYAGYMTATFIFIGMSIHARAPDVDGDLNQRCTPDILGGWR